MQPVIVLWIELLGYFDVPSVMIPEGKEGLVQGPSDFDAGGKAARFLATAGLGGRGKYVRKYQDQQELAYSDQWLLAFCPHSTKVPTEGLDTVVVGKEEFGIAVVGTEAPVGIEVGYGSEVWEELGAVVGGETGIVAAVQGIAPRCCRTQDSVAVGIYNGI